MTPGAAAAPARDKLGALVERAYRELRPRAALPELHVTFFHFANINNTIRLRNGALYLRFSDLLEGAPEDVLRAIAHILLAKLYRKPVDPAHAMRYRRYTGTRAMTEKTHLIRQMRGRKKVHSPRGHHYDLDAIFDDLNLRFFHGLLARPQMTWAAHASKQALGHYDPAHNTIVVSRIFDRPNVPRFAIEYLVFHEMLHLRHPVKLKGSRRCIHSREFLQEEKRFSDLGRALAYLKTL